MIGLIEMKIVHICLTGIYSEGWSYQENLLSKYHSLNGNEVTLIASKASYDKNGNIINCVESECEYVNEYGVKIIRLDERLNKPTRRFRRFPDLYSHLLSESPEVLFVHGCQFLDIDVVLRYKKMFPETILYIDNHADFSNSARNWMSRLLLHKIIWKHYALKIEPYVNKFYGVLPSRVDFLIDIYDIPKDKVELLLMGVDDQIVNTMEDSAFLKHSICDRYALKENSFLIVTGGKIDQSKRQTLLLMDAVNNIEDVSLIVFGSIIEELQEEVFSRCNDRIKYIGFLDNKESYELFSCADLVVFPGRHSVYWEQVVGIGTPLLVKKWKGTNHIDLGGNVRYIHNDSVNEIESNIRDIMLSYNTIKKSALSDNKQKFYYSQIAKDSIEKS